MNDAALPPSNPARPRRRWVAALLSLLAPGLGHVYAGRPRTALLALALVVIALATFPSLVFALTLRPLNVVLVWCVPLLLLIGIPWWSAIAAARAPKPYRLRACNRWYIYFAIWIGYVVVLEAGIRPLVKNRLEAFRIPSASMAPALQIDDYLYVYKWAQAPNLHNGAIVVFQSVEEDLKVVKRVVGVPGDTLAMAHGVLLRNGVPVEEPYLGSERSGRKEEQLLRRKMRDWQQAFLIPGRLDDYNPDLDDWGPIVVPDASYFVLGDNRTHSYDSRYYGFVPTANLLGQPRLIYWSFDPGSLSMLPAITAVHWGRVGLTFPLEGRDP